MKRRGFSASSIAVIAAYFCGIGKRLHPTSDNMSLSHHRHFEIQPAVEDVCRGFLRAHREKEKDLPETAHGAVHAAGKVDSSSGFLCAWPWLRSAPKIAKDTAAI
jgi:hypothetical protein